MALQKQEIKQRSMTVASKLEAMRPQMKNSLPAHFTAERMTRIALNAVQNTPKLLECDINSLLLAIMKSAQLGLEPDGVLGQAYLLPYNSKAGMKAQLIVGYKGLIDLARRSGDVVSIIAKEVCENDDFSIKWHEEIPFHHVPPIRGERGEVIGFWAMARFKDGGFHFDYMSREEVEEIRNNSQGYQSAKRYAKNGVINSPWEQHFVRMGCKTAIRRIANYLPMSVQKANAFENAHDSGKMVNYEMDDDGVLHESFDGETIEGEAEEATGNSAAKEAVKKAASPKETKPREPEEKKPDAPRKTKQDDAPPAQEKRFALGADVDYMKISGSDMMQGFDNVVQSVEFLDGDEERIQAYFNMKNIPLFIKALESRGRNDEARTLRGMTSLAIA